MIKKVIRKFGRENSKNFGGNGQKYFLKKVIKTFSLVSPGVRIGSLRPCLFPLPFPSHSPPFPTTFCLTLPLFLLLIPFLLPYPFLLSIPVLHLLFSSSPRTFPQPLPFSPSLPFPMQFPHLHLYLLLFLNLIA